MKQSTNQGLSNQEVDRGRHGQVLHLFTHRASDTQLFERIRSILTARIANGRVYMEIYVDGGTPPLPYLQTLTCEITDPGTGYVGWARLDAVTTEAGKHLLVRTQNLLPPPPHAGGTTPTSIVRIRSATGKCIEKPLHALLKAKP
jgi:hypothetical protein